MTQAPDRYGSNANAPLAWVPWLQAGVTAMLVVLFLVVVGKARQQSGTIRELQERVQGLENSRALDQTTGLQEQLRSAVERLQTVERNSGRIDSLSQETAALRQELARLRAGGGAEAGGSSTDGPAGVPPLPPVKP